MVNNTEFTPEKIIAIVEELCAATGTVQSVEMDKAFEAAPAEIQKVLMLSKKLSDFVNHVRRESFCLGAASALLAVKRDIERMQNGE